MLEREERGADVRMIVVLDERMKKKCQTEKLKVSVYAETVHCMLEEESKVFRSFLTQPLLF